MCIDGKSKSRDNIKIQKKVSKLLHKSAQQTITKNKIVCELNEMGVHWRRRRKRKEKDRILDNPIMKPNNSRSKGSFVEILGEMYGEKELIG